MEHFTSSELQSNSTANTYRIAWRIGEPIEPGNPWTPTIYFSTLPNGWMPKNDLDLFDQFIFCVKESWLRLCQQIEKYLSNRVSCGSRHKLLSLFTMANCV
jgi:hypothetical protein